MESVGRLLAASGLPQHEAHRLLELGAGIDRVAQITHPEHVLTAAQSARIAGLFESRRRGEPLAYMLGEREFWGRMFSVTPAVLIPREDTELLVELALNRLPQHAAARVLDLGTGSGVLAVTIALERPQASVTAVDASADALAVAGDNARRLGATVECLHGDWFGAFADGERRFELIVGNPPYIAASDPHLSQGDLPHEPANALVSGAAGLDAITAILAGVKAHLAAGGWLMLEHGFEQGPACSALFKAAGFADVQTWPDLAGLPRVTGGRID
jgi:release factor glutamine methyltransferase